jgi:hypothetical protein
MRRGSRVELSFLHWIMDLDGPGFAGAKILLARNESLTRLKQQPESGDIVSSTRFVM